MHIQLCMSFVINICMFRSPSATIFRVYSINISSTIEGVDNEILQDLVHCKSRIIFVRNLSKHEKI